MSQFNYETKSSICGNIRDSVTSESNTIEAVNLAIKASHAGKVNKNYVFYTPRSMFLGSTTLIDPFQKHLQNLHNGDAVGVINEAVYVDYSKNYSEDFVNLSKKIDEATTPKELVDAVVKLTNHPEYISKEYKGLGVAQVNATLYDEKLINDLSSGTNSGKVSIGGNSREVYCSICAEPMGNSHNHAKGKTYEGKQCFAIYNNMKLDHIGFVPDPADTTTETVIVKDSLELDDSSITIEDVRIKDNIQGKTQNMKLEELKALLANNSYINKIIPEITPEQKEKIETHISTKSKHQRASSYLFTDEKLLPMTDKQTLAVAMLAVDLLEDSPQKTAYKDILEVKKQNLFDSEENAEGIVKTFLEEKKEEENTPVKDSNFNLTEVDLTNLVEKIVDGILAKTNDSNSVIADSIQYDTLKTQNSQLETDITTLEEANKSLTEKYKEATINQILASKGLAKDDKYREKLTTYDNSALEVLAEELSSIQPTVKEPEQKQNEHVQKEVPKVTVKDSLTNPTKESTPKTIKKSVGLTQFLNQQKQKN